MIHAFGDRGDKAINLPQDFGEAALGIAPRRKAFKPLLLALSLKLRDEFCH